LHGEVLNVRSGSRSLAVASLFAIAALACTALNTAPPSGAGGGDGSAGAVGFGGTTGGAGSTGAAGTTGTAGSGGAAGNGSPGLIGWWRFDENSGTTAQDSSGNFNHGTLVGGADWTNGRLGSALRVDGQNGMVTIVPPGGSPLFDSIAFEITYAAWIKPDSNVAQRAFATALGRTHEDFLFQDFWLGLVNGAPGCIVHSPTWQGAVSPVQASTNDWTHVACVYDDTGVRLYVNGVSVAARSMSDTIGPISTRYLIGAAEAIGVVGGTQVVVDHYFPGAIDDVRVYDRNLSGAEISALANP
jgi:hypothetical protein